MAIDPQDIGGNFNRIAEEAKNKAREAGAAVKQRAEEAIQTGGRYLREHDLQDAGRELTNLVRRYPLASLGACFGLGCLLGLTWNRR